MKTKLTKNQIAAIDEIKEYGGWAMIGTHTPTILRTHQSLVKKGLLKEESLGNGWRKFMLD